MPKAGLFAGEVTQAAPADGAATLKEKGFQWMEWGGPYVPTASTYSNTEGWAATQNNYQPPPDFPHPFRDINEDIMTMSAVFTPTDLGLAGQVFEFLGWGGWVDGGAIYAGRRAISSQLYIVMRLPNYSASNKTCVSATAEVSLTEPTWSETDWYFMGISYEKNVRASAVIMNLTKAAGFQIHPPKLYIPTAGATVNFPTSAQAVGTSSIMSYGCSSNTVAVGSVSNAWQGSGSQTLVHNRYVDFHDYGAGTSTLCKINGVIDLGEGASDVFGEQALYYSPSSNPLDNEGSLDAGEASDFWIAGTFVPSANLPPVAP